MIRTTSEFQQAFRDARRVSTPLLCVRTADPASTVSFIMEAMNGQREKVPVIHWDVLRGLQGANKPGAACVPQLLDGADPAVASVRPSDMLMAINQDKFGEAGLVFMANAHRFWPDEATMQGIWNLREPFKTDGRTLVMMSSPGAMLPAELAQDVLLLDQPLPATDDLAKIVVQIHSDAGLAEPNGETVRKATDALIGLAAFPAEQVTAMATSKKRGGIDLDGLWERKRKLIEQTPGLSVWRGGEKFSDLGGVENIKRFLRAAVTAAGGPRVVVFVDEIEKAFAGAGTDLSGVKTELTGTMLTYMQDREVDGMILIGPPGAAKSAIAKAAGAEAGIPTIAFDLAAMQSSLVGSSGERLRGALAIIDAVSEGRALFIATCNSIGVLPPELRRRFTLGTFFFDLPTPEERAVIWPIYEKKYGVSGARPNDNGWTGAEIKVCCRNASRLGMSLKEAAGFIVPVAMSAKDQIESLRQQANGKFISASKPGVFTFDAPSDKAFVSALPKRAFTDAN